MTSNKQESKRKRLFDWFIGSDKGKQSIFFCNVLQIRAKNEILSSERNNEDFLKYIEEESRQRTYKYGET